MTDNYVTVNNNKKKLEVLLSGEEFSKKLFPDKEFSVVGISKRIDNFGSLKGWIIEYTEEDKS